MTLTLSQILKRLPKVFLKPEAIKLLQPEWKIKNSESKEKCTGFCWLSVGALYNLLPEIRTDYKVMSNGWHYWLQEKNTGEILDPTAGQLPKNLKHEGKATSLRSYKTGKIKEFAELVSA